MLVRIVGGLLLYNLPYRLCLDNIVYPLSTVVPRNLERNVCLLHLILVTKQCIDLLLRIDISGESDADSEHSPATPQT